jgi:hypothetical protein
MENIGQGNAVLQMSTGTPAGPWLLCSCNTTRDAAMPQAFPPRCLHFCLAMLWYGM